MSYDTSASGTAVAHGCPSIGSRALAVEEERDPVPLGGRAYSESSRWLTERHEIIAGSHRGAQ